MELNYVNILHQKVKFKSRSLEVFCKKGVLINLRKNSRISFKSSGLELYQKEAHVLSCEFTEIFKKTYLAEICEQMPLETASFLSVSIVNFGQVLTFSSFERYHCKINSKR